MFRYRWPDGDCMQEQIMEDSAAEEKSTAQILHRISIANIENHRPGSFFQVTSSRI
jgi:hypothetical protein